MEVLVVRLARLCTGEWRGGGRGAAGSALPAARRSGLGGGVGPLHEARRAAGGLVLVDPALGAGLAQALLRGADRLRRVVGAGVDRPRGAS